MKSLATRLMLTAFLCCQCRSQSPEQHLAYAVDAAIGKIESLSQRFEEMGNQLNTKVEDMGTQMNIKFEEMGNQLNTKVEDMGTQMNIKFEELEGQMDIIQGQLAELQGSSNVEDVLRIYTDTIEMEREFQRDIINQTCNNNMNQMANLQESFSTELDRSIKGCSSKVSNLQELLKTAISKRFPCKEGWEYFNKSCYLFSLTLANWTAGRQECQQMNSNYVKITTEEEFTFIASHIKFDSWVGLNDRDNEGVFKWDSDSTADLGILNKLWWYGNQPNDSGGGEDCILFMVELHGDYQNLLNDGQCHLENRFICEMSPSKPMV